jgi:hypothetical protein
MSFDGLREMLKYTFQVNHRFEALEILRGFTVFQLMTILVKARNFLIL